MPLIKCSECKALISTKAQACPQCGAPLLAPPVNLKTLDTLIIVPGHAIYVGSEPAHAKSTAHWRGTFPGYQDNDEVELYWDHIRTGVLVAARRKEKNDTKELTSLLVFSGGETRPKAGPYAEAQSYWFLAYQNNWFGHPEIEEVATTEEFARDSFENLLFSIHRFHQLVHSLPDFIIVCGFSFKARRYQFHWETISSDPANHCINLEGLRSKFTYIEVNDPPPYLLKGPGGSEEGEAETYELFRKDPLAERSPLVDKERERDRFLRHHPYPVPRP
jgi:hypothetical protein